MLSYPEALAILEKLSSQSHNRDAMLNYLVSMAIRHVEEKLDTSVQTRKAA